MIERSNELTIQRSSILLTAYLGRAFPRNGFLVIQNFSFLAGGRSPPKRSFAPLNGRPQHLIEAAKRGRLDQMILFSAPLTTRAPPGRPAGRPAERPAGRPLTTRVPPIKKKNVFFCLGLGFQAWVPIKMMRLLIKRHSKHL